MQNTVSQTNSRAWRLQDAKSQFSALVDSAMRGVPQHVTRRGKQAVVVLSAHDFEALQRSAGSRAALPLSFVEHLLAIPKEPKDAKDPKASSKIPVTAQPKSSRRKTLDAQLTDLQPREVDFS